MKTNKDTKAKQRKAQTLVDANSEMIALILTLLLFSFDVRSQFIEMIEMLRNVLDIFHIN
jgi:hypothetical protein